MRVGIDLDGVAYDFAASLREYLVRYGLRTKEQCTEPYRWEFYEDWGYSGREFVALCKQGVNYGIVFSHGDPFPGVRDAFQMIKAAGHTIHIVTDRSFGLPGKAAAATINWLARYDLPFDSITFTADKTIAAVDVMVDDKVENYDAMHARGIPTWLLTRPWNQPRDGALDCTSDGHLRFRVLDLYHYAEEVCRHG